MASPRLDLVDTKVFAHLGGKVFQFNLVITTLIVFSGNELPGRDRRRCRIAAVAQTET
jgi:hypothetical protein